jgi:hypothetical protein
MRDGREMEMEMGDDGSKRCKIQDQEASMKGLGRGASQQQSGLLLEAVISFSRLRLSEACAWKGKAVRRTRCFGLGRLPRVLGQWASSKSQSLRQ